MQKQLAQGPVGRIGPDALLRPGPPRNPACDFHRTGLKQALKVRCRVGPTVRSLGRGWPPAGPLTAAVMAVASSLSVGLGVIVIFVFGLT